MKSLTEDEQMQRVAITAMFMYEQLILAAHELKISISTALTPAEVMAAVEAAKRAISRVSEKELKRRTARLCRAAQQSGEEIAFTLQVMWEDDEWIARPTHAET